MIPKIIHYCWFGRGKKSELVQKCIESWRKHLPDYEILEWNEDNFDVNICRYTEQAYKAQKWAFVADYARLYVLYQFGGIYLDTDMMLYTSLNPFLDAVGFFGFESRDYIAMSPIGAEKGNALIYDMLAQYANRSFVLANGKYDTTTNVKYLKRIFMQHGLKENGKKQIIMGFVIYPQICFLPNTIEMLFDKVPSDAITVHYSSGSWGTSKQRKGIGTKRKQIFSYVVGVFRNLIGTDSVEIIRSLIKGN